MAGHPFSLVPLANGAHFIFTPCPGTKEVNLIDSLKELKQAGATAIVTMLSTDEMQSLGVAELGHEIEALGMQWFQLPVEDDCEPGAAFKTVFPQAKPILVQLIKSGETIVIHCRGGSGRTGLMAAVLLLEMGENWADIKPLIQSIRPKALTLEPHLSFLDKRYGIQP
jgi:protein-tyrosine phosphatase